MKIDGREDKKKKTGRDEMVDPEGGITAERQAAFASRVGRGLLLLVDILAPVPTSGCQNAA
jgi:hypothetical protein